MRAAPLLVAVALFGCSISAAIDSSTPADGARAPDDDGSDGAPVTAEAQDARRFAVLIDLDSTSGCSRGSGTSRSRSSMVLELEPRGGALACLGRRQTYSQQTVDGSSFYDSREQRGFAGTWRREGADLRIDLLVAERASCPDEHEARSSDGRVYPPQIHPLSIHCREASTNDSPLPPGTLVCDRDEAHSDLLMELFVHDVIDGSWLFLGPDDGLTIDQASDDAWGRGDGNHLEVRASPEPIGLDAWTRPSE